MEGMLERYLQRLSAMQPPSTFAQLCRQMNEALTAWEPLLMLQNVETLLVCSAEGEKAHQLLLYGHTAAGPVLMRCFYLRD